MDDEPGVLEGLETHLRPYEVMTASSPEVGLSIVSTSGPFAVVVSDMRMPGMDGAAFLGRVRQITPNTSRILLTGQATLDAAIAAVNQGAVLRILTKPCPSMEFQKAIEDGTEQYRMLSRDQTLMDQKLQQLWDQLLRSERLATLGSVAGAVGHELNNMATIFQASFENVLFDLEEGRPPDAEDLDALGTVREHLIAHASQLLNWGKPRASEPASVDVGQVASEIVTTLRRAGVTRHLDVRLAVPAVPTVVPLPAVRCEQVMLNLVKNAADAMTGNTNGRERRIDISVDATQAGMVRCSVRDTGSGIPSDVLANIFDPYFTTKPPERGTGLGLPVVKRIVEGAGGTLSVRTEPGVGTTFTFELPMRTEQEVSARP